MNKIKNNVPNAITCLNLACGVLAIIALFYPDIFNAVLQRFVSGISFENYEAAFALILLGAVADLLDGMVARAIHAVSAIGKELDSLCDLVTFGVAPALTMFVVARDMQSEALWPLALVLVPVAGALRLARFNVDDSQATTFRGLPIPASALFWIGAAVWMKENHPLMPAVAKVAIVVFMAWLMVSPLRMFSFKVHGWSLRNAWAQYLLIIIAVVAFCAMGPASLLVTVVAYVLLSVVWSIVNRKRAGAA